MKLDYKKTFLLGFGFFGVSVVWSIYNSFIPIFLREYALPWWLVGFVMTFDNIAGIIIQPYVGQLSDHTRTRFGRRMPYIMIGAPIAAVAFVLVPLIHTTLPHIGSTLGIMTFVIVIMNIGMAIFRTPVVALMPDITPSALRSKANGIINLMGGLGTAIAFLIGGMLYSMNQGMPFFTMAILMVLAEILVISIIREPEEFTASAGEKVKPPSFVASLRDTVRTVVDIARAEEKSTLFICLAIFSWFMGYNAIETFWTSYGKDVLFASQIASGTITANQAVSKSTTLLSIVPIVFLLMSIPSGFIATRFGRKRTIITGLLMLAVFWLGVYFIHSMVFVYAALFFSGVGWALININSLPIVVDLASAAKIGSYTGLYYFFSMLAATLSPPIVGRLMDGFGLSVMFIFTPAFMLLAVLFMLGVKRSEPVPEVPRGKLAMVGEADL
ncbi:MAG: SLC45 family MFS transporter [Chloroflexota bacterium]